MSGVCEAGFTTAVLPHASAGAIFQLAITAGKFHGVISAHTPTGSRSVTSSPGGTIGIVSPVILFAAPPQYSKTLATMSISPRAAEIGLPPLRASSVGELLLALADQERRRREHAASLPGGQSRPRAVVERRRRDVDGASGVLGAGLRDLGHRGGRRRLDHLVGRAVGGRHPLAPQHQQLGHGFPLRGP